MKRPDYYTYPVVFTHEEGYGISVTFPDLPGCISCGADEEEALAMAQEVLGLYLWSMEDDNDEIPVPSTMEKVLSELAPNEKASTIQVFMPPVREYLTKDIEITVSIPLWLKDAAMQEGVNFSAVLQNALKEQLHLT